MKFIEEIVVDTFLPTSRVPLAEDLRDHGLTQLEVAEALGISQSAVSKYAHGEVATNERVATDPRMVDLVSRVGDGLATGDMTPAQALVEAEVLIRQLKEGDLLSGLHEDEIPELASHDGFRSIHDSEGRFRTVEQACPSVRRGLRMLTNTSGFTGLIPNVSSNLVEPLPDADSVDDVAAIPGRIFDVKGQATVPGGPEFGVSGHIAGALLSARVAGADVNAALNIVYDTGAIEDLGAAGYECIEFDPGAPTDPVRELLIAHDLPETFIVYQNGGYGIEPIMYILGPGAPFNAFHLLFLGLVGYWVSLDAAERGSNASLLWALGCVVFQPLVARYLLYRSRIGGRPDPAGAQEQLVGTFVIGHLVAAQLWFAVRLTDVIASVTYPPIVELQYYLALLAVGVLPGTLLVWNRGWA